MADTVPVASSDETARDELETLGETDEERDNAEPLTLALAGMLGDTLALGLADGDAEALRPPVADVDADAN